MSHAALVNEAILWLVVSMTVLLVLFLCAVIWTAPEPPGSPLPTVQRSAFEALLAKRQLWAAPLPLSPRASPVPPVTRPRGAMPRHLWETRSTSRRRRAPWDLAPGEPDIVHRPTVSGKPPWGPAPKPPGIL